MVEKLSELFKRGYINPESFEDVDESRIYDVYLKIQALESENTKLKTWNAIQVKAIDDLVIKWTDALNRADKAESEVKILKDDIETHKLALYAQLMGDFLQIQKQYYLPKFLDPCQLIYNANHNHHLPIY